MFQDIPQREFIESGYDPCPSNRNSVLFASNPDLIESKTSHEFKKCKVKENKELKSKLICKNLHKTLKVEISEYFLNPETVFLPIG